jgi:hypothetical protein
MGQRNLKPTNKGGTKMIPVILMIVGGTLWLAGELWGVFSKRSMDTTSEWVWWAEARMPILRVVVGVFVLSLFAHFMWGTTLLP